MQALDGEVVDGGGLPGGGDGDDFEAGVVGRGASGVVGVLRLRGVQAVAGFEVPGGRPALAVGLDGVGRGGGDGSAVAGLQAPGGVFSWVWVSRTRRGSSSAVSGL